MNREGSAAVEVGERLSGEQLLAWRRRMLAVEGQAPADPADLDWLLDLVGGLAGAQRLALWLDPERSVLLQRPLEVIEALWRCYRTTNKPLQYLVGRCPWRDFELTVGPGVLIPRQETELLVDLALERLAEAPGADRLCWADLGTGSGALAIALARALPGSVGLAVDASPQALEIAALNLQRLLPATPEPQLTLLQGDWWQPLEPWWGRLQLVVSNPPYIPSSVCEELDPVVRDHEPRLALEGGADGLEAIRSIVAGAPRALASGGWLLLEHHHDQSAAVLDLLRGNGFELVMAHRDLRGVARFASGCLGERP